MSDALAEALRKFSIFAASTDSVITFAYEDLGILTSNSATEEMFGFLGGDLRGQPIEILFSPDRREGARSTQAGFPPELFDGKPMEILGRGSDGGLFPVEVVVTKATLENAIFYTANVRDISTRRQEERALRESEATFRAAIETLGEGLVIADLDDKITYVNSRMAQLAEYVPEQMIGRTVRELLVPEEAAEAYEEKAKLRRQGISEQYDFVLKRKGGDRFWAEINATPFRDPRGRIIGSLGAVMDVTERKRIQEELVAAVDGAEDASRAKSAFLANMSHELRTPLNAIIGYSEMLADELGERQLQELQPDLKHIHSSGKHLLSLINDILDLSKIEAGKLDLLLEEFDLLPLVREVVSGVQPAAAKAQNVLDVRCPSDMGPMRTDPSRLRQVLLNLLGNAVKFTAKGQVLLEVEPADLSGRPAVRFVIRDTGIGISAEQLETLFQPFTQGDHSTTREYGGSGLGLVISRQLCQKMGGDISVDSEPGRGSTVTAILPVKAPQADWDWPARVVAPPVARVGKGPATVLVIDDDALACDLLQRFLTKEGFRVATASGGEEGLRRARELKPTLITLDVVMPRMDGWATLKALKADPELSSIPVIMMTIIDNPKLGYSLGASDYVTKPVDWRRLGAALERFRTDQDQP